MSKKGRSAKAPRDSKGKYVKMNPSPAKPESEIPACPDCGENIYRHASGGYWCEECGERKPNPEE